MQGLGLLSNVFLQLFLNQIDQPDNFKSLRWTTNFKRAV